MKKAPKKGGPSGKMPMWAIVLLSCCGGCGLLAVVMLALGGFGLKALMAPKVPPPPAYAGTWRSADGSILAIGNDGTASFRTGNTSLTGGRVKVDAQTRMLSIKLAGLGQEWRIDTPPSGTTMTLKGVQYKRTAATSTGMLDTRGVTR